MTTPIENQNKDATSIEARIEAATQEARELCDRLGATSKECVVAWDTVEELKAEAGHQHQKPSKNSLESYCDANPDADECRIYED